MFDLFGANCDQPARDAIFNTSGRLIGVCNLLITKGLATEEEIVQAMTLGQAAMDQHAAKMRDEQLERMKVEEPEQYKTLQFLEKLLGKSAQ